MEYTLLIGVLIFLALMTAYGYIRGLIKIVFSLVAMVATIIVAAILTIPVSSVLKNTSAGDSVREYVQEMVDAADIVDVESISNLGLPEIILKPIEEGAEKTAMEINEFAVDALTDTIINALSFFVLSVIIYIVIRIIFVVLNVFAKLPLINEVNKWTGAAVGFVNGLLYLWVAALALAAFGSKPWAQEALRLINENAILSFIYNHNLIVWLAAHVL